MKRFPENSLKPYYLIPAIFAFYILLLPFLLVSIPSTAPLLIFPTLLYIGLFLLASSKKEKLSLRLISLIGGLLTHFLYGLYLMMGLLTSELKS